MLVITRKISERIAVGDDIEIMVVQVKGKQVRIGIKAPRGIKVSRMDKLPRKNLKKEVDGNK